MDVRKKPWTCAKCGMNYYCKHDNHICETKQNDLSFNQWESSFMVWFDRCETLIGGKQVMSGGPCGYCAFYSIFSLVTNTLKDCSPCPLFPKVCGAFKQNSYFQLYIKQKDLGLGEIKETFKYAFKILSAIFKHGEDLNYVTGAHEELFTQISKNRIDEICEDCFTCDKKKTCNKWKDEWGNRNLGIVTFNCHNINCGAHNFDSIFSCKLASLQIKDFPSKGHGHSIGTLRRITINCDKYTRNKK